MPFFYKRLATSESPANIQQQTKQDDKSMRRLRRAAILLAVVVAAAWFFTRVRSPTLPWQSKTSSGLGSHSRCEEGAPKAHTKNGTYCGVYSSRYEEDFFLGVPYARPPVGDLRFRAPHFVDRSFSKMRPATQYSKYCPGYGKDHRKHPVSEDCLYLNIVRPTQHDAHDKLPVAVWFHGGGFSMGSASMQIYNMSFIVHQGVRVKKPFISVSVNYRLAVWGFIGGEDVAKSGETNIGLQDQRAALHWVQENIEAFGGDPSKVTIWGVSAGAASVGFHLTAYGGRDDKLFRAAVMESGSPIFYAPIRDVKSLEGSYQALLKEMKCNSASDTLKCLRDLPFKSIDNAYRNGLTGRWGPACDDKLVQKSGHEQLISRKVVKVPVIAGTNSDEGTAFAPKGLETNEEFEAFVKRLVQPNLVSKLVDAYPDDKCFGTPEDLGCKVLGPPYGAQFRRAAAFKGDLSFIGPRRLTCELWARMGIPAYCYRFNAHPAGIPPEQGAPHFAEVGYVFDNTLGVGYDASELGPQGHRPAPFTGKGIEHHHLATLMSRSWASFFVDMDPNTFRGGHRGLVHDPGMEKDIPQWPAYDESARMQIVFDALYGVPGGGCKVETDDFRDAGIAIINQHNA